ncbi:MAG: EamA family transporter [Pseudomonadota bacterium]
MPIRAILAAILVASCWGGNFTATKFAMQDFPPFLALLLRFMGVALVLAPFALRQPRLLRLRDMVVISMLLIVLQFALVFSAMDMGLSITSVIIATQLGTPFACILAAVVFKDYLGPWRSGGLMVAFFGVMIVAGTPNASEHWGAFALAVLGSLMWASSNIYLKCMKPSPPVVQLLFWPALFSILPLALLSWIGESNQWTAIAEAKLSSWVGISYSLFFSSLIGYGLWNRLVTTYPMSSVVPYSLLVPVVGISAGAIAFGEPITAQIIIGASLTILGVGVITLRRPQLAELEP